MSCLTTSIFNTDRAIQMRNSVYTSKSPFSYFDCWEAGGAAGADF